MEALSAGLASLVVLGWCALAVRFGPRWGFVDAPDGSLKTHQAAAVPLGGVGLFVGLHAGLIVGGRFDPLLAIGTLLVLLIGLVDDRRGLSPLLRLSAAAVAGVVLAIGERTWLWGLVLIVLVVVCVNAVNLIDGLDALAGSTTAVTFLGLAWLALHRELSVWVLPLMAAAALAGFLIWNRPPARVFLGDNGAYLTGAVLAYATLTVARDHWEALVGVALVGAPLFDLAVTVLRRFRAGMALFAGDRDHVYDRLHQRAGWSVGRVSAVFAVAQAIWVSLIVVTEILAGPLTATAVAAALGLLMVIWTVAHRATPR